MTAPVWVLRGRAAVCQDHTTFSTSMSFPWAPHVDPETAVPVMEWGEPDYPCLLIRQVSVTLVTVNVINPRRVRLIVQQPASNARLEYVSAGTAANGVTRRYEFGGGVGDLAGGGAGTGAFAIHREPLPDDLFLMPPYPGESGGNITLDIVNVQAGDTLSKFDLHGELLLTRPVHVLQPHR